MGRIRDVAALDPYLFSREACRQNRIYKNYDGNPPISDTDQEEYEDNRSGVLKIY
jgi:ABC-type transporter lipoprotein component MlaA